jgi:hypothetical protein
MNITVIIPIHEFNEKIGGYLLKALESIDKQEIITEKPEKLLITAYDCVNEVNKFIEENYHGEFTNIANKGKTDYQSQVNFGVENLITDYFTVLEFDDEYSTTYFKNAVAYTKAYPNIDVFLTMMIEVNERNEGIKLTNETVWAQQFVGENGEMGYLNAAALKQYTDFKMSGAIIKKSEFKNIGGFKSNIKLTFMYEFLLRALNNACKIFSIPKIGYKHLANREDSLFDQYQRNMSIPERKFWFDTATNEANFTNDRVIDMSRLPKQIVV